MFLTPEEDRINRQAFQTVRIRRARHAKRIRQFINKIIDRAFEIVLQGYELPHNSRWSLFAELFWLEPFCPICFFYRGAVFGFALGVAIVAMLSLIF